MTFVSSQTLEQYRQQFPSLNRNAYFNFGGQGPMPQPAIDAIVEAYQKIQAQGPFCQRVNGWLQEQSAATRRAIASEIGATEDTITLTENVTTGCNIALWGIDWQAGDRILLTDCEHPGVIAIVQAIARRFAVEVDVCPIQTTLNAGDPVALITKYLQARTRLVVFSHLLWNTGQVLPLTEIVEVCHLHAVRVLVDAAQSAGSLPLNLIESGVDYYAFTGHKWMCGPAGVGGLYVSSQAREQLRPTFIGWRGITLDSKGNPTGWKANGQRYEVATSAYPQYMGLQAAIALHQQWGTAQERYQQICRGSQYLWQQLSQLEGIDCLRTAPPAAGLVSFRLTDEIDHKAFVLALEKDGFLLRTLADPDCIRACVHYFTLFTEIDRLIEVIADLRRDFLANRISF